jgi:asparagine synthase (glutamine-hydrolysing)
MCGFFGYIGGVSYNDITTKQRCDEALESLKNRGPDSKSIQSGSGWILGHSRLSIIDLSDNAIQPMHDGRGNWLVYNGEIYNFNELRTNLVSKGISFFSNSDTEVLLNGLACEGISYIKKLRGMFAFAWLNINNRKLYLCRDRLGVKPLAYKIEKGEIQFASDLFAIKKLNTIQQEVSEEATLLYFALGYIPSPHTIWKNVFKVNPGTYLEVDLNNDNKIISKREFYYWSLSDIPSAKASTGQDIKEYQKKYNELVYDAVRSRLVSDVPVGTLLSSGIDSSLVSVLAQKATSDSLLSFTMGFEEKQEDESPFAREIAKKINSNHFEFFNSGMDALKIIKDLPEVYDEPFADSSAIPMVLLSRGVSKKVKVALTGDGGDEANFGYPWHKAMWKLSNAPQLPYYIRNLIYNTSLICNNHQIKYKLGAYAAKSKIEKWIFLKTGLSKNDFNYLPVDTKNKYDQVYSYFNEKDKMLKHIPDIMDWSSRMDIATYLPDDLMVKSDRASMSSSLELREPLLDHHLLEWSIQCPVSYRYNFTTMQSKSFSRKYLTETLGENLINNRKQGFYSSSI